MRTRDPEDRAALHAEARRLARIGRPYDAYEKLLDAGLVEEGEPYARELGAALAAREDPIVSRGAVLRLAYGRRLSGALAWEAEDRTLPILGLAAAFAGEAPRLSELGLLSELTVCDPLSQALVEELGDCRRLQALKLEDAVFDVDLSPLAGLPLLTSLEVVDGVLEDDGLAGLAGLLRLERLELELGAIEGPGLKHLRSLSRLRRLSLSYNPLDDASLDVLGCFPDLERLELTATGEHSGELAALAMCPKLRRLELDDVVLDDAAIAAIGGLSTLEELSLSGAAVGDRELACFEGLRSLRSLNLNHSGITGRALPALARLPVLEGLTLWSNPEIEAAQLEVFRAAPSLRDLRISLAAYTARLEERLPRVTIQAV